MDGSGSRVTTIVSVFAAVVCGIAGVVGGVAGWTCSAELQRVQAERERLVRDLAELKTVLAVQTHRQIAVDERRDAFLARLVEQQFAADEGFLADELAALVRLTRERLDLMTDVARAKWNGKRPIDDPQREQALLDDLAVRAFAAGVDPEPVRAFFRDHIEAAKILQRQRFDEWRAGGQKEFAAAPDLAADLRPRIDATTNQLLDAYVSLEPVLRSPSFVVALETRLAAEPGGPRELVRRALASLVDQPARGAGQQERDATNEENRNEEM
jgi:chorismate mutase